MLRLWDELSLDHLLTRYPRRPGSRAVRTWLEVRRAGETVTRSALEVRFREFVDDTGLPPPEANTRVESFEVDCAWRAQRVIIELDARSTHGTAAAFERDRERDRILQAAGWRTVRMTSRQLTHTPRALEADLRRLLRAPRAATLAA